jgi:uncharacterized protein YndB with AHSA1/START domain
MGVYRFETRTKASPERAFDLWTNLERMKEWVGGVTKVTDATGPVDQVGTTYTVWFGGMRSRTTVLEAERPRLFRSRFGNLILKGENVATFEADGSGTVIRQQMQTRGLISAIFGRIFASGSYRGSFQGELEAFARLAEHEAAEGSS